MNNETLRKLNLLIDEQFELIKTLQLKMGVAIDQGATTMASDLAVTLSAATGSLRDLLNTLSEISNPN